MRKASAKNQFLVFSYQAMIYKVTNTLHHAEESAHLDSLDSAKNPALKNFKLENEKFIT